MLADSGSKIRPLKLPRRALHSEISTEVPHTVQGDREEPRTMMAINTPSHARMRDERPADVSSDKLSR